jgi:hypothetical protein
MTALTRRRDPHRADCWLIVHVGTIARAVGTPNATWMTRYGNLDTYGLTRTGRRKYPDSADRYNHTAASAEARRADLLPVAKREANR